MFRCWVTVSLYQSYTPTHTLTSRVRDIIKKNHFHSRSNTRTQIIGIKFVTHLICGVSLSLLLSFARCSTQTPSHGYYGSSCFFLSSLISFTRQPLIRFETITETKDKRANEKKNKPCSIFQRKTTNNRNMIMFFS